MFERESDQRESVINRISVFVCLPRYLVETRRELREAVEQNRPAIDSLVRDKIETEPQFQRLGIPFRSFGLKKCTLRVDYILEYLFELKLQPAA